VSGSKSLEFYLYATLAQLVEQLPRKEQVSGSIPLGGSQKKKVQILLYAYF
jgi:hypothetical protein